MLLRTCKAPQAACPSHPCYIMCVGGRGGVSSSLLKWGNLCRFGHLVFWHFCIWVFINVSVFHPNTLVPNIQPGVQRSPWLGQETFLNHPMLIQFEDSGLHLTNKFHNKFIPSVKGGSQEEHLSLRKGTNVGCWWESLINVGCLFKDIFFPQFSGNWNQLINHRC